MMITFAYCFVRFYDGSIPGIGYSLKGFISGGTSSLVDYIGKRLEQEVQETIPLALRRSAPFTYVYGAIRIALHLHGAGRPQRFGRV